MVQLISTSKGVMKTHKDMKRWKITSNGFFSTEFLNSVCPSNYLLRDVSKYI